MSNAYPAEPTDLAKIDSRDYDGKLLGENELGCVHIHGPFGNVKSNIKISYLIGTHPLESKAHRSIFETIINHNNLNYSYYIYNINVFEIDAENEGRMDGQLLAKEFVAPHVIDSKYNLFIDIHSNKGLYGPGDYFETNFVFAPGFDEESSKIMNIIIDSIDDIVYYAPKYRTSPPFITIPVVESGIPTIVYETYSYETMDVTYDLSSKLVDVIDNLKL